MKQCKIKRFFKERKNLDYSRKFTRDERMGKAWTKENFNNQQRENSEKKTQEKNQKIQKRELKKEPIKKKIKSKI